MISTFENAPCIHFNEQIVLSFMKGNTVQYKGEGKDWVDYDAKVSSKDGNLFGPWRYNNSYKWRVKPETVEVEYEKTTVVKVKVEIPAPFQGKLRYMQDYHRVFMHYGKWILDNDYTNADTEEGERHVKDGYVYLDEETAKEAFKILTGEQS